MKISASLLVQYDLWCLQVGTWNSLRLFVICG